MNYIKIKDLSNPKKGFYGIGAPSCKFNKDYPQYLRISDIDDNGKAPLILNTSIDPYIFTDWKQYLLKNNDIVFARTGNSTGRNFFCKNLMKDTVFAGFLIKFSINPESIIPNYVGYYCQSNAYWEQVSSLFTGSTRNNINAEQFANLIIPVPNKKIQQHIVNTIGTIDDLIENIQKIYNKLSKISLTIFELYENNKTNKFNEIFETFNGGTFQSKYYTNYSSYKLITIKNVDDNGFNTKSTSYLTKEKINNKFLLNIGDIILTMTGNIGRTGIVDENNCYLNQRVLKINSYSKLYLFCYLNKYKKSIIQLGKGTAQLNLSLEDLNELTVNNSLKDVIQFKNYDYIFNMMVNYKIKIKQLTKIKQDLLSKYF